MKYNPYTNGCPQVEEALSRVAKNTLERREAIGILSSAIDENLEVLVPYFTPEEDLRTIHPRIMLRTVSDDSGSWLPVFTSRAEEECGPESLVMPQMLRDLMKSTLQGGCDGIVVNPWGNELRLTLEEIQLILGRTEASASALADITEGDCLLAESHEKLAIRYYLRAYESALADRDAMVYPMACRRIHNHCADYFSASELELIPND